MTIHLIEQQDGSYRSVEGYVMKRENGFTSNGNCLNGRWALRDPSNNLIDFNKYRHDLAGQNDAKIVTGDSSN